MQIIISPARKMTVDVDSLPYRDLPQFLPQAKEILAQLKQLSMAEMKAVWQCSDRLVRINYAKLQAFDLEKNLTPALLAFTGLQYQSMGAGVLDDAGWEYVQKHLRILSGFYGVLRPLDGIADYRLGMVDAAKINGTPDLYHYWGDRLAKSLYAEGNLVLNLASQEYAKAIRPYVAADQQFVTCVFGELQPNGKVKQKATRAKQARGSMVRYLAENQIQTLEGVKKFNLAGYRYLPDLSQADELVFANN